MRVNTVKKWLFIGASAIFLCSCQNQTAAVGDVEKSVASEKISSITGQWTLTKTIDADVVWQVPKDSQFTLLINEGQASGRVACNQWGSSVQFTEGNIVLGPARSTRMRCISQDINVESFSMTYFQQLNQGMKIVRFDVVSEAKQLILEGLDNQQWFFKAL